MGGDGWGCDGLVVAFLEKKRAKRGGIEVGEGMG